MKIDLNLVAAALKQEGVEPEKIRTIIEKLSFEAEAADESSEKEPPVKKQFVILAPTNQDAPRLPEIGWVLQIEESASPASLPTRLEDVAVSFNTSKRGRTLPAKTLGELIESGSAKYFKQHGVWPKTKLPVSIIYLPNALTFKAQDNA